MTGTTLYFPTRRKIGQVEVRVTTRTLDNPFLSRLLTFSESLMARAALDTLSDLETSHIQTGITMWTRGVFWRRRFLLRVFLGWFVKSATWAGFRLITDLLAALWALNKGHVVLKSTLGRYLSIDP